LHGAIREILLSPSLLSFFSFSFLGVIFVILFGHHKHRYRALSFVLDWMVRICIICLRASNTCRRRPFDSGSSHEVTLSKLFVALFICFCLSKSFRQNAQLIFLPMQDSPPASPWLSASSIESHLNLNSHRSTPKMLIYIYSVSKTKVVRTSRVLEVRSNSTLAYNTVNPPARPRNP